MYLALAIAFLYVWIKWRKQRPPDPPIDESDPDYKNALLDLDDELKGREHGPYRFRH
jgi:hypothetical protein